MLKHLVVQIDREQGMAWYCPTTSYIDLDVQVVVIVFLHQTNLGFAVASQCAAVLHSWHKEPDFMTHRWLQTVLSPGDICMFVHQKQDKDILFQKNSKIRHTDDFNKLLDSGW